MFSKIKLGAKYSRQDLADIWGYKGIQALARGVVTPSEKSVIILFVTENKDGSSGAYTDRLSGDVLEWEGPNDHLLKAE